MAIDKKPVQGGVRNRTSFYSHFSSPEDLAIHALGELFDVVGDADIARRAARVPAAEADPRVAARFLAGGILGIIGAWLNAG